MFRNRDRPEVHTAPKSAIFAEGIAFAFTGNWAAWVHDHIVVVELAQRVLLKWDDHWRREGFLQLLACTAGNLLAL